MKRYAIFLLPIVGFAFYLIAELNNGRFNIPDFEVYYQSAERLTQAESLYTNDLGFFYRYKYSPSAALPFLVFTVLPLFAAKIAWWLVSIAIIVANLWLVARLAHHGLPEPDNRRYTWLILPLMLTMGSFYEADIHLGQVNQLNFLLFLGMAWFHWYKPKAWAVGLLWAISFSFKPFALILLPYFLWKKEWKILGWIAAATAVWLLLPVLFYGNWEMWQNEMVGWLRELSIELSRKQDLLAPRGFTMFAILARYTPARWLIEFDASGTLLFQLSVLGIAAVLILRLMLRGQNGPRQALYEWALILGLIPMIASTGRAMFVFLSLGLYLLFQSFSRFHVAIKGAIVGACLLLGGNIGELWGRDLSEGYNNLGLIGIAAVLLWSILLWQAMRGKEELS
ncbi:MAG: DUF2029 domain-containing protein [Bacteroidia bacterium]|nr:DUF2029 domain-containing protein [Bacteroidia bacterium]